MATNDVVTSTDDLDAADRADVVDAADSAGTGSPPPPAADAAAVRSRRLALGAYLVLLAVTFVWLLATFDDRIWFIGDDWGMFVDRSLGDPGSWFEPQNSHWSTVPTLVYQVLYQTVGLRSYLPYAGAVMVAHLSLATLLRVVMRRAGAGPWVATVVAGTYVVFGTGQQNIWFAIQISMVTSMIAGVGHLILADHDGPFDRRDGAGLAVGAVGLMASGVGPPLVAMVGIAVLVRRGWRMALIHTVPLAGLYLAWWAWQQPGENGAGAVGGNLGAIARFVVSVFVGVFEGLGQSSIAAAALLVVLVVGLGLAWGPLRGPELRRAVAAPGAMVLGAAFVLGSAGSQRYLMGTEFARSSRYVAMGAALVLPAIGVAAGAVITRWRLAAPVVAVVVLIGVPGNIAEFGEIEPGAADRFVAQQQFLLGAAASPLAAEVAPTALPYPGEGIHQVPIGFLLQAEADGRLPDPPPLEASTVAKIETRLSLSQGMFGESLPGETCALRNEPVILEPAVGDRFAFDGSVVIDHGTGEEGAFTGSTTYNSTWAGRVLTAQVPDQQFRIRPAPPGRVHVVHRYVRRPKALSVVVVAHDMARELPRTLATLAPGYQRGIEADDYEIVLVDNGSSPPFDVSVLDDLGVDLVTERLDPAPPSPARAANVGLARASGELIGLVVDGARMASPGLLATARLAARLADRPVVSTLGWHLGPVRHMQAHEAGYDQGVEDELLAGVDWRDDGYRLFDISVLNGSSAWGWFEPIAESSALFLPRSLWDELGGLDEAFAMPGGGLVNHDLYLRACTLAGARLVTLLGEGTFHQFHGGAATGSRFGWEEMRDDYIRIKGEPYRAPDVEPILVGAAPEPSWPHLAASIDLAGQARARRR